MARKQEQSLAFNWNCIVFSVVLFVTLAMFVMYVPAIREIDGNILHSVRLALSPYPNYIPSYISVFGFANRMLWPQIAVGSVLISHRKYTKAFLLIFFTQATFVVTDCIKNIVCRERPCEYEGFSFPSAHCAPTMCFYGILIYLVLHYVKSEFWRYFLSAVFGIWIFMVAISRMWLGVHFPSDVIAGLLLGFLAVNLYIIVSKSLSR